MGPKNQNIVLSVFSWSSGLGLDTVSPVEAHQGLNSFNIDPIWGVGTRFG